MSIPNSMTAKFQIFRLINYTDSQQKRLGHKKRPTRKRFQLCQADFFKPDLIDRFNPIIKHANNIRCPNSLGS